jgi:Leucine-rich repeat (LRR) protein
MLLLKYLNLSYNLISFIESTSFSSLKLLVFLDLSYNKITNLPDSCAFFVQNLNLTGNPLTAFDTQTVTMASNGMYVYISNCNLTQFPASLQTNRLIFKTIDVSGNSIRTLPALESNKNETKLRDIRLRNLYMNRNGLWSIEEGSILSKYHSLIILDLSENCLSDVKVALNELTRLETLNLSANRLTWIDRDVLRNAKALRTLDLSYNQIKCIDAYTLEAFGSLLYLYVHGNVNLTVLNQTRTDRGLALLRNVYVRNDLFYVSPVNFFSVRGLFEARVFKTLLDTSFYIARHVMYEPNFDDYAILDCIFIIGMSRSNRVLNLRTSGDKDKFLENCGSVLGLMREQESYAAYRVFLVS